MVGFLNWYYTIVSKGQFDAVFRRIKLHFNILHNDLGNFHNKNLNF